MRGPIPQPANLRQRRNKKAGSATIQAPTSPNVPEIPNPDKRKWHPLTVAAWEHAWESPMASQWLETDVGALGRIAILWDTFYKNPDAKLLGEIRLNEARFGFAPADRARLSWEVARVDRKRELPAPKRPVISDPRNILMVIKRRPS